MAFLSSKIEEKPNNIVYNFPPYVLEPAWESRVLVFVDGENCV